MQINRENNEILNCLYVYNTNKHKFLSGEKYK